MQCECDYDKELCEERHKTIESRETRMEKKLDWILALVFGVLVTTIGALLK